MSDTSDTGDDPFPEGGLPPEDDEAEAAGPTRRMAVVHLLLSIALLGLLAVQLYEIATIAPAVVVSLQFELGAVDVSIVQDRLYAVFETQSFRFEIYMTAFVASALAFIWFNGTVVFESGLARWIGAAATVLLLTLFLSRPALARSQPTPSPSRSPSAVRPRTGSRRGCRSAERHA